MTNNVFDKIVQQHKSALLFPTYSNIPVICKIVLAWGLKHSLDYVYIGKTAAPVPSWHILCW